MILQSLYNYYERLKSNPDLEIALPGYAVQKIHIALVINRDGKLILYRDLRDLTGKKPAPSLMILPTVKRSSKIAPQFFWDNTGYVLGADSKGKPDRALETFNEFRSFHHRLCRDVADDGVVAVLKFLDTWTPEQAELLDNWENIAGLNVVFQIEGERSFIHQRSIVKSIWQQYLAKEDAPEGFCLVTGRKEPIARIHPDIKGVDGAQTKGAAIVSFNRDAFCSNGKEQNFNAPISIEASSAYTAALNHLLRRDNNPQRIKIGETTTVFWAERESPVEGFLGLVFDGSDDSGRNQSLRLFLEAAREGRMPGGIDPDIRFYILGLSPNASRLAIRFWHSGTVTELKDRLGQYFRDIAIRKKL
jgi:CRISPR-associated protein Csd1